MLYKTVYYRATNAFCDGGITQTIIYFTYHYYVYIKLVKSMPECQIRADSKTFFFLQVNVLAKVLDKQAIIKDDLAICVLMTSCINQTASDTTLVGFD